MTAASGAGGADKTDTAARLAVLKRQHADVGTAIAALEKKLFPGGPVSPLAPAAFPQMPAVAGVTAAAGAAGVRYSGRDDVALFRLAPGSAMAGTFTRSLTRAAPVTWCEDRLAEAGEGPVGIVVNAGNANAFTGGRGIEAVERVAEATGAAIGADPRRVFMASTGVIGEPLPHERITASLAGLSAALAPGEWEAAARAIMTTDTFPKGSSTTAEIDGTPVTVAGIAKGSGMIAPDMATMLVFVFTDAAIAQPALQAMVSRLTETSFNAITVDGDTSTSDTLLVGATGAAGHAPVEDAGDARASGFQAALGAVMRDLAIQVVRDGEGATKLAEITVTGAEHDRAARRVALSIANSPLVKTALAGSDPNWGRIVMAVGKAGERADRDRLTIRFGDVLVAEHGWVAESYSEAAGAAEMARSEVAIAVDLGIGQGRATVWTCDLTARYVAINADYRS